MAVTMSDFADIPALGDAAIYSDEELEEDVELEEEPEGEAKYRFNGKHIYVTWSKSKIDSKEVFHQKLLAILPVGVRMFGGRELHQDGTPYYHVVFSFPEKKHYPDAAKTFAIEGDTSAIRFEKPKPRQPVSGFLENIMAYCAKDGDTFGERLSLEGAVAEQKKRKWQDAIDESHEDKERLSLEGAVAEQKKRKWQEIIDESDEDKAWAMIRELDPRAYMVNYPALEKAMSTKKRAKVAGTERKRPAGKFRVPKLMQL